MIEGLNKDQLKQLAAKASFFKNVWQDLKGELSPEEAAEYADPRLRFINKGRHCTIIQKVSEKGKTFLKMEIPIGERGIMEWDLSRQPHNFTKEDKLDTSTLVFKVEESFGETHMYATAELA